MICYNENVYLNDNMYTAYRRYCQNKHFINLLANLYHVTFILQLHSNVGMARRLFYSFGLSPLQTTSFDIICLIVSCTLHVVWFENLF